MNQKLAAILGRRRAQLKHTRVLVVAISGNHQINATITNLAAQLPFLSMQEDHPFLFGWDQVDGAAPQELARNTGCGRFLRDVSPTVIASDEFKRKPADILWMIDNDMILKGALTVRFLGSAGWDIIAPIEYQWRPYQPNEGREPDAVPCAFRLLSDAERAHIIARLPEEEQLKITADNIRQQPVYPTKGGPRQVEVDRVGSGCMAIKRHVLEDPRMLLAPMSDPPAFWRNVYRPNYERTTGLDMDFCDRARECGYKIMVDWNAEVGHQKYVDVNEIEMYAKRSSMTAYEIGVRDGVSLGQGKGGTEEGSGRKPGSGSARDEKLDHVGVDRPSIREEANAASH